MSIAPSSTASAVPAGWQPVHRPASLFRRFDFASYAQTRDFLDRLARLSERDGLYPDLGFGPRHANVTLLAGGEEIGARECTFAAAADEAALEARSGATT